MSSFSELLNMASVNKLMAFIPLRRLEFTAAVSQNLCGAFSVTILPRRNASLFSYTTRKKCVTESSERPDNLNWVESLLEMKKDNEASKTTDREPHILSIDLVKTIKGRPWWEKDIIKKLGFDVDDAKKRPVIVKNVASVNKLLFKMKHLLQILPLTFHSGLQEHESNLEHTLIKSNGEMVVVKRLKEYEPETTNAEPKKDVWMLEMDTLKKDLDKKLHDYEVHKEYFKTHYIYKRNQDGKEDRYSFNRDVPKYEW